MDAKDRLRQQQARTRLDHTEAQIQRADDQAENPGSFERQGYNADRGAHRVGTKAGSGFATSKTSGRLGDPDLLQSGNVANLHDHPYRPFPAGEEDTATPSTQTVSIAVLYTKEFDSSTEFWLKTDQYEVKISTIPADLDSCDDPDRPSLYQPDYQCQAVYWGLATGTDSQPWETNPSWQCKVGGQAIFRVSPRNSGSDYLWYPLPFRNGEYGNALLGVSGGTSLVGGFDEDGKLVTDYISFYDLAGNQIPNSDGRSVVWRLAFIGAPNGFPWWYSDLVVQSGDEMGLFIADRAYLYSDGEQDAIPTAPTFDLKPLNDRNASPLSLDSASVSLKSTTCDSACLLDTDPSDRRDPNERRDNGFEAYLTSWSRDERYVTIRHSATCPPDSEWGTIERYRIDSSGAVSAIAQPSSNDWRRHLAYAENRNPGDPCREQYSTTVGANFTSDGRLWIVSGSTPGQSVTVTGYQHSSIGACTISNPVQIQATIPQYPGGSINRLININATSP